jgi:hypothetical protein
MLKGGVIMDVVDAEQARIAEVRMKQKSTRLHVLHKGCLSPPLSLSLSLTLLIFYTIPRVIGGGRCRRHGARARSCGHSKGR